jgi:transposase
MAAVSGSWILFEDESGQSMRPPRAKTWAPRGVTPVVKVRGGGSGRIHVAGMVCYKPGHRSRFFHHIRIHRGRKNEPKSLTWQDYRDLIRRAHQQLGGPIILIWDNLATHLVRPLREFIEKADWLTVVQLPSYAPDLNPQEGIWSLLKRDLGNLGAQTFDELLRAVKRKLKSIQYRPDVINGCLAGTGLTLEPP